MVGIVPHEMSAPSQYIDKGGWGWGLLMLLLFVVAIGPIVWTTVRNAQR